MFLSWLSVKLLWRKLTLLGSVSEPIGAGLGQPLEGGCPPSSEVYPPGHPCLMVCSWHFSMPGWPEGPQMTLGLRTVLSSEVLLWASRTSPTCEQVGVGAQTPEGQPSRPPATFLPWAPLLLQHPAPSSAAPPLNSPPPESALPLLLWLENYFGHRVFRPLLPGPGSRSVLGEGVWPFLLLRVCSWVTFVLWWARPLISDLLMKVLCPVERQYFLGEGDDLKDNFLAFSLFCELPVFSSLTFGLLDVFFLIWPFFW